MDLNELRRISAREELSLNYIAKDEKISDALLGLQESGDIILKGGTAISRVYLKNKRFSEDIDLDVISAGNAKETLEKTEGIAEQLKGFDVSKPRIMKETIRYDLHYTNPLNHKDRIMLEFKATKKPRGHSKRIVNFGFVPHESALLEVYDIETLLLQKIDCVMNRTEGKDFFDLYHMLELPHKRLKGVEDRKEELIRRISLDEKQLKALANAINHYLPRTQRPNWSLLLKELADKIRKY
jgi:predicted nucleotidyltransferase component of viral defense system